MLSARTHCPQCNSLDVVDLADILYSKNVDFFRCHECSGWWSVPRVQTSQPRAVCSATPRPQR